MAVTIVQYPGGLERPEYWASTVQGLTPIGRYTISDDQALSKFPGLAYDAGFIASKNAAPTSSFGNEDEFYNYEQQLDSYNKALEADKQKQADLSKAVEDKRAVYLSGLKDPAAIRAAYDDLQSAIKASSDYAISTIGKFTKPTVPTGYKPTGRALPTAALTATTTPETQKNLKIVQQQASSGIQDSKEFLDNYVSKQETLVAQNAPASPFPSTQGVKYGDSTPIKYDPDMKQYVPVVPAGTMLNTLIKQAQGPRGELLNAIAQNQGPSTPVKYDENMQMFVPNPGAGRPTNVRLKSPPLAQGPRGEALVAQALPASPRGMDRAPGTYHPSNIMPLITPGSRFSDKEGYMIQDPFKNSPQTGPGLSEQKQEFDPYKAQVASSAAKEYRRQAQVEDPFRTGTFG